MKSSVLSILVGGLTLVHAHGYFEAPIGRQPGDDFKSKCGEQAYNMMASDINGNIQGLESLTSNQADYDPSTCDLWKCKGMTYADNTAASVQTYTPGQSVDLYFHIQAPHSGIANVSIIDLSTSRGTTIGEPLISWDEYAMTSETMKASWQNFTVTMPSDLGSKCSTAGSCAIQLYWDAASVNQTYESCIDFTMSGSSSKRSHARDFA